MSLLDVFCIMTFVRQIFPYYSKNEMLYCICGGQGGILLGADDRNSIVYCNCRPVP